MQNPQRALYWGMKHRNQKASVRDDWKWLQVDAHEYLFDVVRDPRERANLILRAQWTEWDCNLPPIPADAKATLVFDERHLPRPTF